MTGLFPTVPMITMLRARPLLSPVMAGFLIRDAFDIGLKIANRPHHTRPVGRIDVECGRLLSLNQRKTSRTGGVRDIGRLADGQHQEEQGMHARNYPAIASHRASS